MPQKTRIVITMLKLLITIPACLLLSGCSLLFYPVTGFYIHYKMEFPKEIQFEDALQYSFTVQNPIRGWTDFYLSENKEEKSDPFKRHPVDRFVFQKIDDDGNVIWTDPSPVFWTRFPYNRIGRTTIRILINDKNIFSDLKSGKRKMGMAIYRLGDMKLGPWLSTCIGEETLTPVVIPADQVSSPNQKDGEK